jgi:GNAT superfamily N-acetyltransferase
VRARSGLWTAADDGGLLGSIAIDGEDLGDGSAHLRWFIVADRARGTGLGRRLLEQALAFCDAQGFACTQLWTFDGLHAARRLYEANGFVLAEQWPGTQWGPLVQEQRFERTRP